MKNLSGYNLNELGNLLAQLRNRISDYSHISEVIPNELTKLVEDLYFEVDKEEQKRLNDGK